MRSDAPPARTALRTPSAIAAILALAIFKGSEIGYVLVVALITFPYMAVELRDGLASADRELDEMARVYRFGLIAQVRHVGAPFIAPYIFAALRNSHALAWKVIVVAEIFGNGPGDGRTIISDDYPDYKLIILGDRLSTTDTPVFQLFNIATDFDEQSPLNIAGLTGTALAAYNHLIAKDAELGGGYSNPPSVVLDTLYFELPTGATPPVPNLTNPGGAAINVNAVTVNGAPATFVARVNSGADLSNENDDVADALWVKVTITPSGPYTTAHVIFPNTPTGTAREYDSINTILVKP